MKRISLGESILLFLAKALGLFFRAMPVEMALFIARRMAFIALLANIKRYWIAYANLKSAFRDKYTPKQYKKMLKSVYENMLQGIIEVLLIPKMDDAYLKKYIRFENIEFPKEALKKKKGMIFLTAHFGSWEIGHSALPYAGMAYMGIARRQKPLVLNDFLKAYREKWGCLVVFKGMQVKEAFKRLSENKVVAMLVDQDAGKKGVFVKLFGREASFNKGVMEMALKTGAALVPGFAIRQRGPYIKIRFYKPIEIPDIPYKQKAIKEAFRQYASVLESLISEFPDQWLWQHKRWKSTPVREVVILDDGKTGHLRQSESVVKSIKDIWVKKGYDKNDVKVNILNIQYKNTFLDKSINIASNFAHKSCQGCMRCMKFCLEQDSYNRIMSVYADIVISCGSSTSAANLLLSKEANARSVVIMKPSLVNVNKFDLAIIPKHDNPAASDSVVATDGALNLIDEKSIEAATDKFRPRIGALRKRVIGILIGGSTKNISMRTEDISSVVDSAVKVAQAHDADILVTTSRRTPAGVESLLKQRLSDEPRCKLLVIANVKNPQSAVEAILGYSNIVLVSQESISMISEAASAGCCTFVFKDKETAGKRHEAFLHNLKKQGYIDIIKPADIYEAASEIFSSGRRHKRLDDSAKIEPFLEKLL
jgi:KDO2-lipid IV(A) lauroyltransferase